MTLPPPHNNRDNDWNGRHDPELTELAEKMFEVYSYGDTCVCAPGTHEHALWLERWLRSAFIGMASVARDYFRERP